MKTRLTALLLALCMMLPCAALVGCKDQELPTDITTDSKDITTEAPSTEEDIPPISEVDDDINLPTVDKTVLDLIKNGKNNFYILYAGSTYDSAGTHYKNLGDSLANSIKSKFGSAIQTYSSAKIKEMPDNLEILIGPTGRPESDLALAFANGADGFVIKAIGRKLVINAYTDEALSRGVSYFISKYIERASDLQSLTFSSENDYASSPEYPHAEYRLAGYSYKPYTIVIPQKAEHEVLRTARRLQYTIGKTVGVLPQIVYDTESAHAEDFEILIGNTSRTSDEGRSVSKFEYLIALKKAKLEITAGSSYAYEQAASYIEDSLLEVLDQKEFNCGEIMREDIARYLQIRGNYAASDKSGDYRILFHNVWGWNEDTVPGIWGFSKLSLNATAQRNLMMSSMYRDLDADVIALQEYTSYLMRRNYDISPIMSSYGYSQVCTSESIGSAKSATPIFYKTDKFELLEHHSEILVSGTNTDKYITVAVLRDKENANIFAVISLHMDYRYSGDDDLQTIYEQNRIEAAKKACSFGEAIQVKYGNCPVFAGGDFNCLTTQAAYRKFIELGYSDVQSEAKYTDPSSTAFGKPTWDRDRLIFDRGLKNSELGSYGKNAIDHIMFSAPKNNVEFIRFDILTDPLSSSISDHMPHLIDFNIK